MTDKAFKGGLRNCTIVRYAPKGKSFRPRDYGKNLGFLLLCDFDDHPYFRGMNSYGGHTSLVTSMDGDGNVETLNSRYKILDDLPLREEYLA